jgi:hypothetical protein
MVEEVPCTGRALFSMVVEEYLGEDTEESYTFDTSESIPNYRGGLGQDSLRLVQPSTPSSSAGQRRSWSCKLEAIGNGQRAKILIEDIRLFVPPSPASG